MGILTFKGGVHPYDGKELSKDKPIQPLNPKGIWFILCHSISARQPKQWYKRAIMS